MAGGRPITRRAVLRGVAAAAAGSLTGLATARPGHANRPGAAPALGVHETVEGALRRLFGGRPLQDGVGLVTLDVPPIAENGAVVPVSVEVIGPVPPGVHVKHIYVVADRNRIPVVARATLTPAAGHAFVGASIRLGETGDVRAIVERSDGSLLQVTRPVRVTVGGCGG
jgi:sulfur-oxidizing protein SoxY